MNDGMMFVLSRLCAVRLPDSTITAGTLVSFTAIKLVLPPVLRAGAEAVQKRETICFSTAVLLDTSGIFLPHLDGEEPLALQQKIVGPSTRPAALCGS